ncbi:hypothetical protein [Ruminococcus sp.]|uniref:hypothetical protein n=1 Tax=Ruminococcus sp. TaxID=41978 RepID=UPI00260B9279|nr:hypothetical protein [Ruminococcus sp.]MDD6988784.1 hypothetical protein [Ruminococcus sp.]
MEMLFQIEDGVIKISKYKVVYKQFYDSYVPDTEAGECSVNERYFKTEADAEKFVTGYLSKHKALEYVETAEIDTSSYAWIDGIKVPDGYICAQDYIDKLMDMGEEEYNLSLTTTTEDYLLDLDCRLSMIELGVTE